MTGPHCLGDEEMKRIRRGDSIVETKVKVSALASGASGLILSLLSAYVFQGEVPGVVSQVVSDSVGTLVPAGVTFAAGWLSKHTPAQIDPVFANSDESD